MDYKIELLATDPLCPNIVNCFLAGRVAARPGKVQLIVQDVDDPELLAVYADRVGPGERLVEIDAHNWPGVNA